jgi:PPK2 family polyphosphate:nucleotide phosphotransferase
MRLPNDLNHELRVPPGQRAGLGERSTGSTRTHWLGPTGHAHPKDLAERDLEAFKHELEAAQELLYASDTWALLLIFQAIDAAGKDGTIKHVMSGVNPQGCQVFAFRQPSGEDLRHDFLWRCAKVLPERGRIGIFNRSYYEEVLVVRVHPELLAAERLPPGVGDRRLWEERFEDINAFEHHLVRNGTVVVKFFLHLSKEEQRRRLLERLEVPEKQWKFSTSDLAEREHFDAYRAVYEEALSATSTSWAPWYVVPADHKPAMRAMVGGVIVREIERLGLRYPPPAPAAAAALEEARGRLLAEGAQTERTEPGR